MSGLGNVLKGWDRLLKLGITYVLIMLLIALGLGVTYREVSKAFLGSLPLEKQLVGAYYLSLMHGHTLMMGVLLPTALLVITYLVMRRGLLEEGDFISLRRAFVVLMVGSSLAIALLTYKGVAVATNYPYTMDLTQANSQLFMSDSTLREGIYGVAHLLLGIGIVWYVIKILSKVIKIK